MGMLIRFAVSRNPRRAFLRIGPALFFLAVADALARNAAGADALPDIETIRAAVDSYAAGITALEGKFAQTTRIKPGAFGSSPDSAVRDERVESTFAADVVRHMLLLDVSTFSTFSGKHGSQLKFNTHEVKTFDGSQAYTLIYSRDQNGVQPKSPVDVPTRLNIGFEDATANQYVPWDFCGLRIFGQGTRTLAGLLGEGSVSVEGEEEVNGTRCVRVAQAAGEERPLVAWLDPAHDHLPRRIEVATMVPDYRGEWRRFIQFDVLEFRKFRDEAAGQERWFPAVGEMRKNWMPVIERLEVLELKINSTIAPGRFSILEEDLPDGVLVNVRGQKESYSGGRKDLWEERQRLLEEEDAQFNALIASPPGPVGRFEGLPILEFADKVFGGVHWSTWVLVVSALVLAVVGGVSLLRHRSRLSK